MSSLIKNYTYQIVYRILTIVTPFITAPILARALGTTKLGIFSASYAFCSYFMLFAMLGVEHYGNRTIAAAKTKEERTELFWGIYSVQMISSCLSIVLYVLIILFKKSDMVGIYQGIWLLSCVFDINWFYWGIEQFKKTITRNIVIKLITVFLIISLVKDENDLIIYILIMSLSALCSQLVLWINLRHYVFFTPKFDMNGFMLHFPHIIKLFVPILAISVYHIMDKSMLDWLSSEEELGLYYSADKIVNIPIGVINASSAVMLPRIATLISQTKKQETKELISKSVELTTFLICSIGFGISAVAKEFVPVFYGKGYEKCVLLTVLFVPVFFAKSYGELIRTQYLIPAKRDNIYITAVCVGAVVNFFANIYLISRYDSVGAVLGTFASELVVLIFEMIGANSEIHFLTEILRNGYYFLVGFTMLVFIRLIIWHVNSDLYAVILGIVVGTSIVLAMCTPYWVKNKSSIFTQYVYRFMKIDTK